MSSHNTNCKSLRNKYRCSICKKGFMMEWAKKNHEKLCKQKLESEERNERRNKNG